MATTLFKVKRYSAAPPAIGAQTVYLKQRWVEDDWIEVPWLQCTRAAWTAAPGISTAELHYVYGCGKRPEDSTFAAIAKLADRRQWFVKISFDCQHAQTKEDGSEDDYEDVTGTLDWFGVLQVEIDARSGLFFDSDTETWIPRGEQVLYCFGLEHLLERAPVVSSIWDDLFLGEQTVDMGMTFNKDGVPNRSTNESNAGFERSYTFADERKEFWSTYECVRYLLARMTPRNEAGELKIPFDLHEDAESILPTSDKPIIDTEGQSVRALLNRLMPRQRGLSWIIDSVDETGLPFIVVRPFSLSSSAIGPVGANANTKKIIADFSDDSAEIVKLSTELAVDQVIVRGQKRTSTASYSIKDGTTEKKWTDQKEEAYEKAASGAMDYPSGLTERRRRNKDARSAPELADVYSHFGVVDNWDGKVSDGDAFTPKVPASPDDDDSDVVYPNNPLELRFLPRLALRSGYDYSDVGGSIENPTEIATGAHDYLKPLLFFKMPEYTAGNSGGNVSFWVAADKIALAAGNPRTRLAPGAERTFSARIQVPGLSATKTNGSNLNFFVRVSGAQHFIAGSEFTPLPNRVDEDHGGVTFNEMIATLTFEDSRYCEGLWPASPAATDHVIKRVIYAGTFDSADGYRKDYIAPETLVGVTDTGERLDVGSAGGFIRDDTSLLTAIAEVAYSYYGRTRRAIEIETRPTVGLSVGDLIVQIGDESLPGDDVIRQIETPVTQLAIQWPQTFSREGAGDIRSALPRMAIQTDFADLDPIKAADGARLVTVKA